MASEEGQSDAPARISVDEENNSHAETAPTSSEPAQSERGSTEAIREAGDDQTLSELKQVKADKIKLEGQYRNLLGKLSSMRDTLGEKLKEDAEELDRREVQINALTETNDKQTAKVAELESSLQDQEDRNAQLSNDLSTLRARISSSEKASTDESSQMQSRLRDLEKILDKVKMEREEWQSQADEEHLRCESALESNKDLLEELETIKNDYRGVNGSLHESEKALRNVESLLSESQLTNQQEFDELKHHYELQVKELKEKNEEQRKEVADAKANLELFRQDAGRTPELEQECKEKTLLIGKVRHEAVILNEHLTEALKRLKEYNTSDSVDRQLMSNILLQFVTTPRSDGKRFEMLNLLASILSWNQYEREQAGIAPKSSRYPIPSSPDSPSSYFRRSTSRTRPAMTSIEDNASFGQLFVEFLLKETGAQEGQQGNQQEGKQEGQEPWQSPIPTSLSSPDLRVPQDKS